MSLPIASWASSILVYAESSIDLLKSHYFLFSSAFPSVPMQDPGILENIEETLGMLSQNSIQWVLIYLT